MSQRGLTRSGPYDRTARWVLRRCSATRPQPSRPAKTPYGVHMRSTSDPGRGTWAAYVLAGRTRAGLNKTELGRLIGRDRMTVTRWEDGKHRPDDAELVARVAEVLGLDQDEALAAAGMRPGVHPPSQPTLPPDPERDLIMASDVPDAMKRRMLERLHELRMRDQQRRLEDIRWMLDHQES